MAQIDQLFKIMVQNNASDLHLRAGSPPYLRLHGNMVRLNYRDLSSDEVKALIFEIISEKQQKEFTENWELDCSYAVPNLGRFRCNVFIQRNGLGGVFRVIPEKIKTLSELNLPQGVLKLINAPKGLVLVTGPTGSGKSTTLASMIHEINISEQCHIITIEDPIEFVHQNHQSVVNQREVKTHTKSFSAALKSALREDPDIILVGELRDLETISLALTAAETGHLVFGTLHTNGAANTIARIIDVFPPDQQAQIRVMLSESLRGVVSQGLIPRLDLQGRVAAIELLINTTAVANLIREGKTFQIPSAMQTGRTQGMIPYEVSLEELERKGLISKAQADEFMGKALPPTTGKSSLSNSNSFNANDLRAVTENTSTGARTLGANPGTNTKIKMPFSTPPKKTGT